MNYYLFNNRLPEKSYANCILPVGRHLLEKVCVAKRIRQKLAEVLAARVNNWIIYLTLNLRELIMVSLLFYRSVILVGNTVICIRLK